MPPDVTESRPVMKMVREAFAPGGPGCRLGLPGQGWARQLDPLVRHVPHTTLPPTG